jgi:hypothetical protein
MILPEFGVTDWLHLMIYAPKDGKAATAISFNLKLFTYNIKDFMFIPGIRLYE